MEKIKYTIITGIKTNGDMTKKEAPNMTLKEAVEIAREFRDIGYTDISSKTGYPINCPNCKVLVDVDQNIEGFQKYCKICETEVKNKLYFDAI